MPEPLVSIEMITFNHAPYIVQAIEGVLMQKTNFPIELVIGEDCSTDGTREMVFEYQKKYADVIRVITSEKNVGIKKNVYRTKRACRGKYVAFCEGDDYWHNSEKLQRQVDYMECHPECGLVYSSYDVYHEKTKKLIRDFVAYRKWRIPENLDMCDIIENRDGIGACILTCTVMVRHNICVEVIESDHYLYKSNKFLMGDTQVWSEISRKASLHFIPESFATHRITDESASRSKNVEKQLRFSVSGGELGIYLCKKYNLPKLTRDIVESYWMNASMRLAFETKDRKLANELRRCDIKLTPKNYILYLGTKYTAINVLMRITIIFRKFFIRRYSKWL